MPTLFKAWRHSPFDRFGWLAFLLWLVPLIIPFCCGNTPRQIPEPRESVLPPTCALSWIALIIAVLAVIVDVNAMRYVALALALGAWMPRHWLTIVWLVLAIAWMPALGWLGASLKATGLNGLRVLLGAFAAGIWALKMKKGLKL